MVRKVFISGASGFIGNACIELLKNSDCELHAISSKYRWEEGVNWHKVDLTKPSDACSIIKEIVPSHVLHLAWFAEPNLFWNSDKNLDWLFSSLQLVKAIAKLADCRVVISGSCAEYDWGSSKLHEYKTPVNPSSIYGSSKLSLKVLSDAVFRNTSVSFAWARIFFPYGVGEPKEKLISSSIQTILNGGVAECKNGHFIRDYLYIDDVASALVKLLFSPVQGVVNISSGESVTLESLVRLVANTIGEPDKAVIKKNIYSDDCPRVVGDNLRLREEVGWSKQVSLEAGVEKLVWAHQNQTR